MNRLLNKLSFLLGRKRYAKELDEEMAFHREQAERTFIADGMSPTEARFAALRQFGNSTHLREQSHETVSFGMESVVHDAKFALRQLRRQRGFTLLAVIILALGIGASVAIFGFVDAALLQPLPYHDPATLMDVAESANVHPRSNLSYQDYVDWKRLNRSFGGFDVYTGTGFLLHKPGGAEPVPASRVTAEFFDTLGVQPLLGRTFRAGEDQPGAAKVVILTYGAWLKRFGARNDIVGQSLQLDSDNYTIVGVLPREFSFAPRGSAELWVPISELRECEKRRSCHSLYAVGRLRPGVTKAAALEDVKAIAAQLERMYPDSNRGQGAMVQPLTRLVVGDIEPILLTLLAGAMLLLLIAAVNVSSLLLVRSESRRREIAVRGALGATRARLICQFVTEGLLLAAISTATGLGVALWLMRMLTHLIPKQVAGQLPFLELVGLNAHTALFALLIAVLTTALLTLTPSLRLGFQRLQDGLGEGGRGSASRVWKRLGSNLVVAELAVAVILLVGAGLLGKSFYKLLHVEMGFEPDGLAMVNVQVPPGSYEKPPQIGGLYKNIQQRVSALPGVQSVALTSDVPVQCFCDTDWIRIVGKPFNGEHNEVVERDVSASYMATIKARLLRGRMLREEDQGVKPTPILINQTLAKTYFPGEDAIGKKVGNGSLDADSMREVVGVIADFREGALDDAMIPGEYFRMEGDTGFVVMVRTSQNEKAMLPTLVSTLHAIDPNLGVYGEITMQQSIESTQSAMLHQFSSWLVGGFALVALMLGVVGLYGVIAYSVSQRTREIGVRMALGAQREAVYRLVLGEASRLIVVGVLLGLAGAIGAARLMRTLLFGVQAWDVGTLAGVALVLSAFALLASYFPARKAATVNPTEALRAE